jgi:hypothetical protein
METDRGPPFHHCPALFQAMVKDKKETPVLPFLSVAVNHNQ